MVKIMETVVLLYGVMLFDDRAGPTNKNRPPRGFESFMKIADKHIEEDLAKSGHKNPIVKIFHHDVETAHMIDLTKPHNKIHPQHDDDDAPKIDLRTDADHPHHGQGGGVRNDHQTNNQQEYNSDENNYDDSSFGGDYVQ
uniref:Uncharacterized protein n=1 Tax=Romanomermis culicivorax TaxID=13658 RepID=A0A915I0N9_ROMCU